MCGDQPDEFLARAFAGGVDIVQLRMKEADDAEIVAAGRRFAALAAEHGALFILNDRPDLVDATGADGVHVGQDDAAVHDARALVGPERIVGLSTHTPEQIDAAADHARRLHRRRPRTRDADQAGAPGGRTRTRALRRRHATVPFFAIGGISPANVAAVRDAGADRIAVVRALTDAPQPDAAARTLRAALTDGVRVGSAQ